MSLGRFSNFAILENFRKRFIPDSSFSPIFKTSKFFNTLVSFSSDGIVAGQKSDPLTALAIIDVCVSVNCMYVPCNLFLYHNFSSVLEISLTLYVCNALVLGRFLWDCKQAIYVPQPEMMGNVLFSVPVQHQHWHNNFLCA